MSPARFIVGDVREVLATLEPGSIDVVVTSPPFLALRSYLPADHPDKAKEIGSEPTPGEYIDTLLDVTEACTRVLAPHGSLCFELGDTYSGSGGAGGDYGADGMREGQEKFNGSASKRRGNQRNDKVEMAAQGIIGSTSGERAKANPNGWPLDKSLCLIPELFRIALVYGFNPLTGRQTPRWRARNVVRWVRPNPPVGALGDKFRPATSDLVVACKARDRWFDLDAVRSEPAPHSVKYDKPEPLGAGKAVTDRVDNGRYGGTMNPAGAPPLDWWNIPPTGYTGSHYAVYPPELCERPIEAMCPRRVCRTCGKPSRRETTEPRFIDRRGVDMTGNVGPRRGYEGNQPVPKGPGACWGPTRTTETTGWSTCGCPGTDGHRLDGYHTGSGWRPGIVLDPFAGTGTTLMVATGHGRDAIGIDLDESNADLARERLGMFLDVEHHNREGAA